MKAYGNLSDLELIGLLKRDDQAAFTEIYRRYWERPFSIAANKLGDLEEAREIVQNIFVSLWDRRENWTLEGH